MKDKKHVTCKLAPGDYISVNTVARNRSREFNAASITDLNGYPSDANKVNKINIHTETQN